MLLHAGPLEGSPSASDGGLMPHLSGKGTVDVGALHKTLRHALDATWS